MTTGPALEAINLRQGYLSHNDRGNIEKGVTEISKKVSHVLDNTVFRRLVADRDIQPESMADNSALESDGSGASNLIRRFIVSSNPGLPRDTIHLELLNALNRIFGQDGYFTEIQVQYHEKNSPSVSDCWEIYLGEENKGLIPLSRSGSGLKTVLLVLMNLIAMPVIESKEKSQFTFAFEELENNLHPALLRRLLQYIERLMRSRMTLGCFLQLTQALLLISLECLTMHRSSTLSTRGIPLVPSRRPLILIALM